MSLKSSEKTENDIASKGEPSVDKDCMKEAVEIEFTGTDVTNTKEEVTKDGNPEETEDVETVMNRTDDIEDMIAEDSGKNICDSEKEDADRCETEADTKSQLFDFIDLDQSQEQLEAKPSDRRKSSKGGLHSSIRGVLYDLLFYAGLIFVCIYLLPNYVLQRTIVDGESMENTLMDEDHLYVEKIGYHFDMLERFDIIVFYPYGRENDEYYVKRIIGMPGETVQIIGSDIYINGEVLKENYGKDPINDPQRAAEPIILGEDEYFVMGDNRNVSKDSRDPSIGNVKKKNIGGRVIFRVSPWSRFGTVD